MAVDGDGTDGGGDSQPSANYPAEKEMPIPRQSLVPTAEKEMPIPRQSLVPTEEKEMPIPRLSLVPNNEHVSDSYDDPNLLFSSCVLRSLEKYLPPEMLTASRNQKAKFMSDILRKYFSGGDLSTAKRIRNYRQRMILNYEPRFTRWHNIDPEYFLLPSFRKAISDNTVASLRDVIFEPYPRVYAFQMFQRDFFEILIAEVENIRKWAHETNFPIKRPYKTSKHGVVFEDFGLDIFLKKLMADIIFPLSKVLFPEVCGAIFDSHYGFFIENGEDRDAGLGYHEDNSEITLNVCLKKQFAGGETIFAGTRCKKHPEAKFKVEEIFCYSQTPGQAILHHGRHRHGAKTTTTPCYWANMILYGKSSLFREMETYQKEFSNWCGQCSHETKEKFSQILAAKRQEMIRIESGAKRDSEKPWRVYVRRSKK